MNGKIVIILVSYLNAEQKLAFLLTFLYIQLALFLAKAEVLVFLATSLDMQLCFHRGYCVSDIHLVLLTLFFWYIQTIIVVNRGK